MAKFVKGSKDIKVLYLLNILMNTEDYISTADLVNIIGCDRKTIYYGISQLEVSGFGIEVKRIDRQNCYKFNRLYEI